MTLLVTLTAAVVSTIIWYFNNNRNRYKLGTLSLIYWGASLLWFIDFAAEYINLRSEYFNQSFENILSDSILGFTAVVIGLIAWVVIIIIKYPKNVFKKSKTNNGSMSSVGVKPKKTSKPYSGHQQVTAVNLSR